MSKATRVTLAGECLVNVWQGALREVYFLGALSLPRFDAGMPPVMRLLRSDSHENPCVCRPAG